MTSFFNSVFNNLFNNNGFIAYYKDGTKRFITVDEFNETADGDNVVYICDAVTGEILADRDDD